MFTVRYICKGGFWSRCLFCRTNDFREINTVNGWDTALFETGFITYIITEGILGEILFGYRYQNSKGLMLEG